MTKLNFQQFRVATGVSRQTFQTVDAREAIADLLYTHSGGIKALRLAFKIYEREGEAEYDDQEVALIRDVAERYCLPSVIDSLRTMTDGPITH